MVLSEITCAVKPYGILQVKVAFIRLCTRSAPFAVLLSQTTVLTVVPIGPQAVFPKECSECTSSTDTHFVHAMVTCLRVGCLPV